MMNVVGLVGGRNENCQAGGRRVGHVSTIGFRSITPKAFEIFELYLVGL